jgi:hypothetical protein
LLLTSQRIVPVLACGNPGSKAGCVTKYIALMSTPHIDGHQATQTCRYVAKRTDGRKASP